MKKIVHCYDSNGRLLKKKRVKNWTLVTGRMKNRSGSNRIEVPREETSDWYTNTGSREYPEVELAGFSTDKRYRGKVGKTDQPYRGEPVKPVNPWEAAKPKEVRTKVHKAYRPMIIGKQIEPKRKRPTKPGRKRAPIVKVYGKIVFRKTRKGNKFVKRQRAVTVESYGN